MPAKKQKLDRASRDEEVPTKKAIMLTAEVMVIDDPACIIPCFILFETGSLGFV